MKPQTLVSDLLSTADGLVQASNTLNQGPCLVAAYLLSTSNNGCKYSFCVFEHCRLISCSLDSGSPHPRKLVSCPEHWN